MTEQERENLKQRVWNAMAVWAESDASEHDDTYLKADTELDALIEAVRVSALPQHGAINLLRERIDINTLVLSHQHDKAHGDWYRRVYQYVQAYNSGAALPVPEDDRTNELTKNEERLSRSDQPQPRSCTADPRAGQCAGSESG